MRLRTSLAILTTLALGSIEASAQSETRPHAFRDEPVMSINNSYLGYGNFVVPDYPTPRYINPHAPVAPVTTDRINQPPQRVIRWFGLRRRGR